MSNVQLIEAYQAASRAGERARARALQGAFVVKNEGLVQRLAGRYAPARGESDKDDVLQAGRIGLLRALEDFDTKRGTKFSTYAAHWIRDAVQRWAGKPASVMKPRTAVMPADIAAKARVHRLLHGTEPTAADLGVTEQQLTDWTEAAHMVELDAPHAGDDESRFELADDPAQAQHTSERLQIEIALEQVTATISARNREIAYAVLWDGEGHEEVGKRYGLCRLAVLRIVHRVEERLKRAVLRALDERIDGRGPEQRGVVLSPGVQ